MWQVFAGLPKRDVHITYTVGGIGTSAEIAEPVIGNWKGGWPEPRPLTTQLGLATNF